MEAFFIGLMAVAVMLTGCVALLGLYKLLSADNGADSS